MRRPSKLQRKQVATEGFALPIKVFPFLYGEFFILIFENDYKDQRERGERQRSAYPRPNPLPIKLYDRHLHVMFSKDYFTI